LLDGKSHRVDGPAVIRADGKIEFWVNGIKRIKLREILPLRPENHSNDEDPCAICREAIWLPTKIVQPHCERVYENWYCEECIASWFDTGSKINPGTNIAMNSPEFKRMWRLDEGGNVVNI
jgi:hypothetical protein